MTQSNDCENRMEASLIDIAIESWKFSRIFCRAISKLDASESNRYFNQLRYFQKKLEEHLESNGFKLVNIEGQSYDPGIAALPINLGDFDPEDLLSVEHMVEPIIMGPNGLRRQGSIMLRKA